MKQKGGILHLGYFGGSYVSPHHVHVYSLTQSTSGYSGSRVVTVLGQVSAPYWASVYVARVSQAGHVRRISGCSCPGLVRRFSGLVTYDESRLVHVRWLVNKKCYCKCYTFCQSVDYILLYGTKCHPMSHISSHIIKCHNIPQGNARYGNLAGGEKDLILMTLLQNTM